MPGFGSFVRARLRWLSIVQIVALLFVQIAVAAHACPAVAADAAPAMADCSAHALAAGDLAQPQLCKAHCVIDDQAVVPVTDAVAPAAPMLLAVLDWRAALALTPTTAGHRIHGRPGAPRPSTPPLYLRLRILRQ